MDFPMYGKLEWAAFVFMFSTIAMILCVMDCVRVKTWVIYLLTAISIGSFGYGSYLTNLWKW